MLLPSRICSLGLSGKAAAQRMCGPAGILGRNACLLLTAACGLYFKQECVVLWTTERICAAFGERQQLRTPHWFWMKFNAGRPNRHDREFGRSLKRLRVIGQTLPLPKQAGALR